MSDGLHLSEERLIELSRRPRRPTDKPGAFDRLVQVVRSLALGGVFQPSSREITEAADLSVDGACRLFGSKTGLCAHVALRHAGCVVGGLGLSAEARLALSPRDERAIAMAVLAGRRLGAGE